MENKNFQVIKVPAINSEETEGCERAGNGILEKLKEIKSNEQGKIVDGDKLDLEEIHIDNKNLELTNSLIYENSFEAFEEKDKLIFLGGDNSISYSVLNAFKDYCKENRKEPCLIVFNSNVCLKKGNKKFPTNLQWLRSLVENGFPARNVLIVGARNIDSEELEFLKENKIQRISINTLQENLHEASEAIMEFANKKEMEVYLSINFGILDPVFAPAVKDNIPGGLSTRELIYILQRINRLKNLKAADIVEINAELDKSEFKSATLKTGAKILAELI